MLTLSVVGDYPKHLHSHHLRLGVWPNCRTKRLPGVTLLQGPVRGRLYKFDISLTLEQMRLVVGAVMKRVMENADKLPSLVVESACFGHCGDLNLHLNVLARPKAILSARNVMVLLRWS